MTWGNVASVRHSNVKVHVSNQKSNLPLPKSAQIEVTNKCNLRCQMCPLSDPDYRPPSKSQHLSLKDFKILLDRLPSTIETISLQGLGEPLLNRDLIEIIRYAHQQGKAVTFFTNSTLLTRDKAIQICRSGLSHLIFSLDGGTKQTFERIRQGADFDEVIANMRGMATVKEELGASTPTLGIMVVGMKQNIHEIPLIIDIAHGMGVPSVTVKNLYPGEGIGGDPLTDEDIEYLAQTCAGHALSRGIRFSHPQHASLDNRKAERSCRWLWDATYVMANGFVTPCCFSYEGHFPNLKETPFEEIWNSGLHHDFREELLNGMPALCEECPAYSMKMVSHTPDA